MSCRIACGEKPFLPPNLDLFVMGAANAMRLTQIIQGELFPDQPDFSFSKTPGTDDSHNPIFLFPRITGKN